MFKTTDGREGLDWSAVAAFLEPERQHAPLPSTDRPAEVGRLAAWVERLQEGNRNDGLFWAACRAVENGQPIEALAEAALKTGLEQREIQRTIQSALRATRPFEREAG